MRLGSLIRWLAFLVLICWAGYTLAGAGFSYYSAQEIVDKALRDAAARHRAAFLTGSQMAVEALAGSVRSAIILNALHDGMRLDEGDVSVAARATDLSATVRWAYPIITYGGREVLVVPMSIRRTYEVGSP